MAAGDVCPSCGGVGGHRSFCGGANLFTSYRGPEQPTRRERIATAALQGLLANDQFCTDEFGERSMFFDWVERPDVAAVTAVELADHLIAELDKGDE